MNAKPLEIKIGSKAPFVKPFILRIRPKKKPVNTVKFILLDKEIKAAISFPNARAIFEGLKHNYEQFILPERVRVKNSQVFRLKYSKVLRFKRTPLYGSFTYHAVVIGKKFFKFADNPGHSAPKIIIENDY